MLRNLIVLVTLVFGSLALLYFTRPVSAANKFWIASAPGNFNVNANWSTSSGGPANTTAPGPADLAIFDGNGLGNCTIPVDTTVIGIQINSGYTTGPGTGTVLQGTSNLTLTGAFSQADGTFTGGSGTIDFNGNFTLSGGTFTASSTTTSFAVNLTQTGGTFAPNGGTVVFDAGGDTNLNVPTSLLLNNVTVNKTGGGRVLVSGDPDTLVAGGTLTLTDGVVNVNGVNATLEAQGGLSIASTFDGGNIILLISGAATRTVTLPAGVLLPRLTVNAPNVTVNTTGVGAITFTQVVTIQSVASFTNGAVDFVFNAGVAFNQSGGTFTGGSGVIDFNGNFILTGGTFTASSTTTSFAATFTPRGTFAPNGGTVVFDGGGDTGIDLGAAPGVPGSLTLNNVTVNKSGGGAVSISGDPDTLVVAGTLTLTDGVVNVNGVNATLEAQGNLSIASTFGGGNIILLISGAATRTVPLGAGALLPRLTVNAPNVTVNTTGAGAITFTQPVNIQSIGLFTNGAVDFIFNAGVTFTQSGGTFTGGSGLIDFNSNFTLSGGTFTASSTTTSFAATFTKTGGTFNPNGGTVVFDGTGESVLNFSPPLTLNNLTVNKPNNIAVRIDPQVTLVVAGTLTLTDGVFDKNGAAATTTLEAQGDVAIASTFDGGSVNFRFGGSANQTYTNGGGLNVTGSWTVDKPAGGVTLASNLILINNQPLTITSGTLDQGASFNLQTSNTLTVGPNGILRNFGGGNFTLGGNVSNSGIININGGGTGCGDPNGADPLQIRSSLDTTVRTWSGSGTFSVVDVDVNSQAAGTPPGTITAFGSSVLGPNMGAGWALNSGCPVEINSQPTNQTGCVGGSANFSVGAAGTGLTFQWRRAGTPISNGGNISIVSGPNSSTLTINPVGAGDAASYDVVVTSSLGLTATSNSATLSLLTAPAITTNPVNNNVCDGATASFTAAASGNPTPTVQWQVSIDGGATFGNISGATSTTLSFTASASQNGNRFRAVFSNSCSSATTTAAALTVNPPDLAIDKSHTGDFTVGTNGVYAITVTNSGSCSTNGTITVTDTLPNGLSFVSGTGTNWNCLANGQDVTCTNAGPFASAAVSTIMLTVGVAQSAVPAVTNTATVSTPNDVNASNNADSDPTTVNGLGGTINAGELIISEFRLRGPGPSPTPDAAQMAADEFVEIYNNTNSNITVQAADGSAGFAVAAADGVARCIIPNATVIPARGHFLCVNSVGYSLSSYPAGNQPQRGDEKPRWGTLQKPKPVTLATGITPPSPNVPNATGDATYTLEIPDNRGLAIFRTANAVNFTAAERLDAVGPASEVNTLYKEGNGYPDISAAIATDHAWVRRLPDSCTGSMPGFVNHNCTTPTLVQNTPPPPSSIPQDSGDNLSDFIFVDVAMTETPVGNRRLGTPGPENLTSPIVRGNANGSGTIQPSLIDPQQSSSSSPNRVRTGSGDSGTLEARRKFTNNTGADITRLRFRIMDVSTFPAPVGIADLRAATFTPATIQVTLTDGSQVTVVNTVLEQPPTQGAGGGFNATLSAGTVTLGTPLPAGASLNANFVFFINQAGKFRVFVVVEALP